MPDLHATSLIYVYTWLALLEHEQPYYKLNLYIRNQNSWKTRLISSISLFFRIISSISSHYVWAYIYEWSKAFFYGSIYGYILHHKLWCPYRCSTPNLSGEESLFICLFNWMLFAGFASGRWFHQSFKFQILIRTG